VVLRVIGELRDRMERMGFRDPLARQDHLGRRDLKGTRVLQARLVTQDRRVPQAQLAPTAPPALRVTKEILVLLDLQDLQGRLDRPVPLAPPMSSWTTPISTTARRKPMC